MAHPLTHAKSSARRFGGIPEDYLPIHDLLDSSKAVFPDNRHRALTHNSWFFFIVERIFGHEIRLTCLKCDRCGFHAEDCPVAGDKVGLARITPTAMVRYICEQHVLEDFGGHGVCRLDEQRR